MYGSSDTPDERPYKPECVALFFHILPARLQIPFFPIEHGDGIVEFKSQSLPPGWQLIPLGPARDRRDCCVRLISPDGREITFIHKPFQFACEITRQLERDMDLWERQQQEKSLQSLRIARPEQVGGPGLHLDEVGPESWPP